MLHVQCCILSCPGGETEVITSSMRMVVTMIDDRLTHATPRCFEDSAAVLDFAPIFQASSRKIIKVLAPATDSAVLVIWTRVIACCGGWFRFCRTLGGGTFCQRLSLRDVDCGVLLHKNVLLVTYSQGCVELAQSTGSCRRLIVVAVRD